MELPVVEGDIGVVRLASSATCESFMTDIESNYVESYEGEENSLCAANPSRNWERTSGANPGSPLLSTGGEVPNDDFTPISASVRPPVVRTEEASFAFYCPASESDNTAQISKNLRNLVPHVLLFTQRPYDFLQRKIHAYKRKLVKLTLSVAFHSASPLDILLHRRSVAIFFLLVAAIQSFFAINDVVRRQQPVRGTAFRFTPLELRSGTTDVSHPFVSSFRVFSEQQSCLQETHPQSSYIEGKHFYSIFENETTLDAFSISTAHARDLDPVRYIVSVEREGGVWAVAGYHRNLLGLSGELLPGRAVLPPDLRGDNTIVDLRAWRYWPWFVGRGGGGLGVGLGLAGAGAAGLAGAVWRVGRPVLYGCWAAGSGAMATACVCMAAQGEAAGAVMWGLQATVFGVGSGVCWWQEQRLVRLLPCLGLSLIVVDLVVHGWVVGSSAENTTVPPDHAVLGSWMVVGGCCLWLLSLSQRRAVTRVLAADRAVYAGVWQTVCDRAGAEEELARLEAVADTAREAGLHEEVAAQSQRIVVQGGRATGAGGGGGRQGSVVMRMVWWLRNVCSTMFFDVQHEGVSVIPLRDLDQIYAQATCLQPILRGKVQQWAWETGGMFGTQDGELVRWREVRGQAEQRRRVKWGQIKAEGRAVEKVIRCYGEDVSRLVDVCRQSVVFETVGELADCLAQMVGDRGVELVRVKNRMSEAEDGAASAGFRNVSVNLRVVEDEARSLGVDTHVCEVQLLLADFARMPGMQGRHQRYRLHRDYHRPQLQTSMAVTGWLLDMLAGSWSEEVGEEEQGQVLRLRRVPSDQAVPARRPRNVQMFERLQSESSSSVQSGPHHAGSFRGFAGRTFLGDLSFNASFSHKALKNFSQERLAKHVRRTKVNWSTPSASRDVLLNAFRQLIQRRNTSTRGSDGHLLDFWGAMESVSTFSVFFVRHPVQGAFTKLTWRLFFLFIALAGLGMEIAFAYYHFAVWHTFPIFRFSSQGNRVNTTVAPASHGIAAFGVASHMCRVHHHVTTVEEDGPTMTVRYARPVSMNGVWYQTAIGPNTTDYDPVRFLVEGSHNEVEWSTVAASIFLDLPFGGYQYSVAPRTPPAERGQVVIIGVNEQSRASNIFMWLTVNFTFVGCGIAAVRATFGNLNNVLVLSAGLLMTFVSMVSIGAWFISESQSEDNPGVSHALSSLGHHAVQFSFMFLIMGGTILFFQRYVVYACAFALASGFIARGFQERIYNGFPPSPILLIMLSILVVNFAAIVVRWHILWYSRRVVAGDKAEYDKLWARICASQREHLQRLETVSRASSAANATPPRQCYSPAIISGATLQFDRGQYRGKQVPIMDINQIYAQATCVHPILLGKVQQWAWETGGMFGTQDGELVRWREVRGQAEQRRRVKWGQIKAEGRAVEKVIRCYGEDVSRLVDVCRQSVVFETVGELADCLAQMVGDRGVELVRVKNRMSEAEDGAASAGFRNVSVNLRVVEDEARSLGVDTHVCEVQLLLVDFARLQKVQGHKRYVQFRNARGE